MDGGGALMNQGIHSIDLLQYIMGPVKSVSAHTRTLVHDIEVEDTAVAILEFENNALGMIQATTSICPGYPRMMEICGDKGSIFLEEDSIIRWDIEGCKIPDDIVVRSTSSKAASSPIDFSMMWHSLQIQDIMEAIRSDKTTFIDPFEGRKAIEIIRAIYESSKSGKLVKLSEYREE